MKWVSYGTLSLEHNGLWHVPCHSAHCFKQKLPWQSLSYLIYTYSWHCDTQIVLCHCYGLPVRFPYLVSTCAHIDSIKRVNSEPSYCLCTFSDLSSVHDNFGDEDVILRDILLWSEDISKQDPHNVSRCQTSLMWDQIWFVTPGKLRSS